MKNKNIKIVLLGLVCALLIGAVGYTLWEDNRQKQTAQTSAGNDDQDTYIYYEGKKYKPDPNMKAVLFMGIDKTAEAELNSEVGNAGQTDSLNLLVLNKEKKEAQILQISRDAMVDIDVYGSDHEKIMTAKGQIALQYAYGDGKSRSCRLTTEKVSELLCGMKIQAYVSLTLDGITAAADAIGGVKLTVPNDYTAIDPMFEEGREIVLSGEQAEKYVRSRDTGTLDSNNQRMERQAQFMSALITQMQSNVGQEGAVSLYQTMEPYMVTNMTGEEMMELAEYSYSESIEILPGEITEEDGHAQYIVDNEKLRGIIVKTFYKPA